MFNDDLAENFLAYSVTRLVQFQTTIASCCQLLTEEQMWHRGGDHENSIANLLLHLSGNLGQLILHRIYGAPDIRDRDVEFSLIGTHSAAEAYRLFKDVSQQAANLIASTPHERLLEIVNPQPSGTWNHATVLEVIYRAVSHVDHHTGQIILLTKQMVRTDLDLSTPPKR